MEEFPVRNALGYGELLWSLRQWVARRRATQWPIVLGTVEGFELLMARQNGWFVIFYSYGFDGARYSGEERKWLLFSLSSVESRTSKVTARFPIGSKVNVRVDPKEPSRSIAEL